MSSFLAQKLTECLIKQQNSLVCENRDNELSILNKQTHTHIDITFFRIFGGKLLDFFAH